MVFCYGNTSCKIGVSVQLFRQAYLSHGWGEGTWRMRWWHALEQWITTWPCNSPVLGCGQKPCILNKLPSCFLYVARYEGHWTGGKSHLTLG